MPSEPRTIEAEQTSARTLQNLFDDLSAFGDRPAVGLRRELGARWWSYRRLHAMAIAAAGLLEQAGIGHGDAFLVRAPNSPEWVAFFLGAGLRGAVVVPLDLDAPDKLARRIADEVGARLLVTTGDLPALDLPARTLLLESLYSAPPDSEAPSPRLAVAPQDPLIIFYTSGTTSEPKGVVLSHGNLMVQFDRFRPWRLWVRWVSYRMMIMAPMSHAQGVIVGIGIPLTVGLSALYTASSDPGHLMRILRDNRVTLLSTVPRSLSMLGRSFLERPYGKSGPSLGQKLVGKRWRFVRRHFIFTAIRRAVGYRWWVVIVGGAPLPDADERFWRDSGLVLVQGYGLTETTAMISITQPFFGGYGSVGRPLPHQDIEIAEDGEILVRGPHIMPGYFGEPSQSADITEDGYLRTGDLGRLDSRRRLYLLGRKKEVIVTGEGFNVHAGDVEARLAEQPGVRDSVVLGVDREGHTQVHAVLLLAPTGPVADVAARVVEKANEGLQAHQRIHAWTVWPEPDFPRGQLLKAQRKKVAEQIQAMAEGTGSSRPSETPSEAMALASLEDLRRVENRDDRLRLLARYVLEQVSAREAGAATDAHLGLVRDLGLSSLDVVELLFLLEQGSGVTFERVVLEEGVTLGELGELVANPDEARPASPLQALDPPAWAEWSLLQPLRRLLHPPLLGALLSARARVEVRGREQLEGLDGPAILVGIGHEHALDVLLVRRALPPAWRRRLAVISSRWVFGHYLDPEPDVPLWQRWLVGLGFHLIVPILFPFALLPHFGTTREGLMAACRLVDRGFSPIVFEGRGIAVIAKQTGVPIVPVHLEGNENVDFVPGRRPEVKVRIGTPLAATPDVDQEALIGKLEQLFAQGRSKEP